MLLQNFKKNLILQSDVKSIVQAHTVCTMQVDKNNVLQRQWRHNHRVTDTFLTLLFANP